MTYLSSLPDDAILLDVYKRYPASAIQMLQHNEHVMRGPSPFSPGERELMAGYVSALNDCVYCKGVHGATAVACGIPEGTLDRLIADIETAPVAERLKPVFRFVKTLTEHPAGNTQADVDAIIAAGWNDDAVHSAASVCGLYNFFNRYVEGLGLRGSSDYFAKAGKLFAARGYLGLIKMLQSEAATVE